MPCTSLGAVSRAIIKKDTKKYDDNGNFKKQGQGAWEGSTGKTLESWQGLERGGYVALESLIGG
jgi:hypothetical protein